MDDAGDTSFLTAIVLTLNEEVHLARCLASLAPLCDRVLVLDSGSSDRTVEIARSFGAQVEVHAFTNYATQMNRALEMVGKAPAWIMRIDADEVVDASAVDLHAFLRALPDAIAGVLVNRRMTFMGHRMRWGGMDPVWQLRLWRGGCGRCEQRWMDEHMVVDGQVVRSGVLIDDINLHSLTWWTEKHNRYASREAVDILARRFGLVEDRALSHSRRRDQIWLKRMVKERVFLVLPPGLRSLCFALARYILLLGFLDGRAGFFFIVLQGFWYRALVDAKVLEIEAMMANGVDLRDAIRAKTGIDVEMDGAGNSEASAGLPARSGLESVSS